MLPREVANLKIQLLDGELSLEDFFCLINTMYELEESRKLLENVLEELGNDTVQNIWRTDLKVLSAELKRMYDDLYVGAVTKGNQSKHIFLLF